MPSRIYGATILLFFTHFLFAQPANDLRASVQLQATVQTATPAITLQWQPYDGTTAYTLYRRTVADSAAWGVPLTTLAETTTSYEDTDVEIGVRYEYRLLRASANGTGNGYLYSGIQLPEVEERGKLLLLVDDRFSSTLAPEIDLLIYDLEMDCWQVQTLVVSPDSSVAYVKNLIVTAYQQAPEQVRAVWLLGHIPVPYSGNLYPDGHDNHIGAWPADVFYGELDGSWTDQTIDNTSAAQARNHNVPGDGKYDQTLTPSGVELMVGRVDFYNLPAFAETEEELLRRYILKNHAFKRRQFIPLRRGLIENNFGGFAEAFGRNGLLNFVPAVGTDSTFYRDYDALRSGSYLWSYGCGGGNYRGANGISNTNNFAVDSLQGVFTMLFGSYFGDWDSQNNFLRSALATGTILSNSWAGRPHWAFHPMAMGATTGYCARQTQNNAYSAYDAGFGNRQVHTALMGDPTLRLFMVTPPSDLILAETDGHVQLSWTAPDQAILGYHVYRQAGEKWERLNTTPVEATSFTDSCRIIGTYHYMIKALALEQTPSGSYYNLSLGITDSIQTTTDISVMADFSITNFNDGSIQLTNQSAGAQNYYWLLGNGLASTDENPFFNELTDGELTITLVATNACQRDTSTQTLSITSTDELTEETNFRVFPNPTQDYVHIQHSHNDQLALYVELRRADGVLLSTRALSEEQILLSLKNYPSGIYQLVLRSGVRILQRATIVRE